MKRERALSGPIRASKTIRRRTFERIVSVDAAEWVENVRYRLLLDTLSERAYLHNAIKLFEDSEIAGHYAVCTVTDRATILELKIFLSEIIRFIREGIAGEVHLKKILDAGDSDGIVLKALGLPGVGLNIEPACVRRIAGNGIQAVQGDIEDLPFPDRSFDYAFCFETIEHLENPVKGLKELARVCRRGALVSVPWVESTRVRPRGYSTGALTPENEHVFEFSEGDFQRAVTHAGFEVARKKVIDLYPARPSGVAKWFVERRLKEADPKRYVLYELDAKAGQVEQFDAKRQS